jgi:catechol 2,3-dioxygenase-like lactoylglutathione lyase family enzyme
MVKGVANVRVPVQDIERALDFYQNTLGFQPIQRDGPQGQRRRFFRRDLRARLGQGSNHQGYGGQRPPALRAAALVRNGTRGRHVRAHMLV